MFPYFASRVVNVYGNGVSGTLPVALRKPSPGMFEYNSSSELSQMLYVCPGFKTTFFIVGTYLRL